jgi:hypothetical protein
MGHYGEQDGNKTMLLNCRGVPRSFEGMDTFTCQLRLADIV